MFDLFKPDVGKLKEKKDVKRLINALKNRDRNIRWAAAQALGEMGDSRAIEPLVKALEDEDSVVKLEAIEALGKMGEQAFSPLVQALKHEDLNIRREAARNLGERKDVRAVEPLMRALLDEYGSVRYVAIEALGEIGDAKAVELLIQLPLGYDYEDERKAAVEALVKIGKPAVEPLIQALKNENAYIRSGASECLGKIKDSKAVEPLIQVLKDEVAAVRKSAVSALGSLHSDVAVEPLVQALKDRDYEVRYEAAKALMGIGEPAVKLLIPALRYADSSVRELAAQILGEIKDARAAESLIKALKDGSLDVQRAAAGALFKIGELVAAGAIIDWLFESERAYTVYSSKLLGDYTDYILMASSAYISKETVRSFQDSPKAEEEAVIWEFRYGLQGCNDAIYKLCNIQTQISSNILHKVAQKKDVQVEKLRVETMLGTSVQYATLSFESQREMAKKELERRGNPPYEPSVYLRKEAWKIK